MDPFLVDFAWFIGSFLFGIALGCMTGLIPGFHVNNVALIALSMSPIAVGIGIPLNAVAGIIVACGTVHTFLNYIPSALVGAPDGDTALALLPGHRMLISGQAAQGVAYSARGSQMGMLLSVPLLIVARLLFGSNPGLGLYEASRDVLPWLLLIISTFLIMTETTRLPWPLWMQRATSKLRFELPKPIEFSIPFGRVRLHRRWEALDLRFGNASRACGMLVATGFFLLSGFYGWAVFELPARSPVGMPSATLLMPGLAGLFGIANLIDIYVTTSEMPPQEPNWEMPDMKPLAVPTFLSAVVSSVMAILPGMTAAQATVVVMSARNVWGSLTDPNYIPADFEYGPGMRDYPGRQAAIAVAGAAAATALPAQSSTTTLAVKERPSNVPTTVEKNAADPPNNEGMVSKDESRSQRKWIPWSIGILATLLLTDALVSQEYRCSEEDFGAPITIEGVTIQPTREVCGMVYVETSLGLDAEFQAVLMILIQVTLLLAHLLDLGGVLARRFGNSRTPLESASTVAATEMREVSSTSFSDDDMALFEAAKSEAREAAETSPDLDLDAHSQKQDLEVIAVLSSVNTAVTVMVLGFLYMVGRPRSGAALALNMMYPIDIWNTYEPPADFIRLLAITIGAGLIAVPLMMKVGKGMLKLHELIPLRAMVGSVILFVTALVWFSTGWIGVGTLLIGTLMGLMPPRIGIRRSHGMGIILVPIMVYTFAAQLDGFGFI